MNPWGQILVQREEGAGVVMADVNKADMDAERTRLPAIGHRVL